MRNLVAVRFSFYQHSLTSTLPSVAHCLASVGDVEGLKMLKERGGTLSTASKSGTFPLHEAALAGKNGKLGIILRVVFSFVINSSFDIKMPNDP